MRTFAFALFLFAVGVLVAHVAGCKPASEPKMPGYCYDATLLKAAVLRCTDKSSTREASRACKKDLLASCGVTETVSEAAHE